MKIQKQNKSLYSARERRRMRIGFLYAVPWLIGFLVFKGYPFLSSLYYSFTDMNLQKSSYWYTLDNYRQIFTDPQMLKVLTITFKYAFLTVPLKLTAALFIAYILCFNLKGVRFFRTAYYIPSVLGGSIAVAVLWKALFQKQGVINNLLMVLGIEGPSWLGDPGYALFLICLLRVWQFGSSMIIFLATLKGVPRDLYEAASIDGANKWKQFFKITIPMISPVIFYNLITQLCAAFQEFNGPYVITNGGPNGATTLISLLIYNNAFLKFDMGMASAQAWVLFTVVGGLSLVAFMSQKKWVYYSDEDGGR